MDIYDKVRVIHKCESFGKIGFISRIVKPGVFEVLGTKYGAEFENTSYWIKDRKLGRFKMLRFNTEDLQIIEKDNGLTIPGLRL